MLRQEVQEDYNEVEKLVYSAFESLNLYEFKDPTEHNLVAELRKDSGFMPELSIVVQEGWDIVGHIINTVENGVVKIELMSVLPVLQKTGVGLQLVLETRDVARKMGFKKIIVNSNLSNFKKYGFCECCDDGMMLDL